MAAHSIALAGVCLFQSSSNIGFKELTIETINNKQTHTFQLGKSYGRHRSTTANRGFKTA